MTPPADPLLTLLSRWLSARQGGSPVSPEELCRDRPDLLPELWSAIRAHQRLSPDTTAPGGPDRSAPGAALPAAVGGFEVTRRLGGGGMGEVFAARDVALGREVAVKVMRPDVAARPGAAARFLREARAAAALQHDHIAPVYAVGEHAGAPYLVMPRLTGEPLDVRLARAGRLAPGEVLLLGRQAAEGLAAAHAAGIVHRDVKPANLWLEPAPGGAFRVKVLDFGLAWSAGDAGQPLTTPGAVMGTPAYMAPEQADGRPADPRADLFALGAVLYEAATGTAPFRRPTLTATLKAVASHHPPDPHELNAEVPPGLAALVLRMLAKSPGGRPPSARAVADELAALTAPAPAAPAPAAPVVVWDVGPAAAPAPSHALTAVLALALGLLVAVYALSPAGLGRGRATARTTGGPLAPAADAWGGTEDELFEPADPAPPPPPLRGSVDLLVYRVDRDGSDVLVTLDDPRAMPLRTGDHFKIAVEVSRPAYLYLFWVDEAGRGEPVYPWRLGEWGSRVAESPRARLDLKAPNGKGFQVTGQADGMETVLLLARAAPLDVSDDKVRGWFSGLKPLPYRGPDARVWFENFDVLRTDGKRGIQYGGDVAEAGGPLGLQADLERRIGKRYDLARAISFARVGSKTK